MPISIVRLVAYIRGKRDLVMARKLRCRLKQLKFIYISISIKDNNYRLRHQLKGVVRIICCLSKKLNNLF